MPRPPWPYHAVTIYVPPRTTDTALASFVLRKVDAGAWRSYAEGRWLLADGKGDQSDLLSRHADALLDLAHVLAASGRFPGAQAAASKALDLYQRKGSMPGTRESLGYLARFAHLREDLSMPNSEVPRVELNHDGTVNLVVNVYGFDPGTPIEISGHVIQENGAIAPFYSVQEMPQSGSIIVARLPAVPPSNFAAGFPITVIARAAQVWITSLEADTGTGALQSSVFSDPLQAAWISDNRNWAVSRPAFDVPALGWDEGDTVG